MASITPRARTGAAGARPSARSQQIEAMAPQKPAPSDWRQAANTDLRAARSQAARTTVSPRDCMAWVAVTVAAAANSA